MTRTGSLPFVLVLAPFLGGCPSDPPENPPVLWLGLDGRETEVRLVDFEPEPY